MKEYIYRLMSGGDGCAHIAKFLDKYHSFSDWSDIVHNGGAGWRPKLNAYILRMNFFLQNITTANKKN